MLIDLIEAISIKLNTEFGSGYKIYTESVAQGLKKPCFFILLLEKIQKQVLGKRYLMTQPFDIHYFPSTKDQNTECHTVAERLETALETVTMKGDILRGTGIHYEIVNDVLHFFVNYDFHIYKEPVAIDKMTTITVETDTKG
jgi:hypothetical protein